MKAVVINANGGSFIERKNEVNLDYMQKIVNGYIQTVNIMDSDFGNLMLVVNESGALDIEPHPSYQRGAQLQKNEVASLVCDPLFGNVLIIKFNDDGEVIDLNYDDITEIESFFKVNLE